MTSILKSLCCCAKSQSWLPTAPSMIPGTKTGTFFLLAAHRSESFESRTSPNSRQSSRLLKLLLPPEYRRERKGWTFLFIRGPYLSRRGERLFAMKPPAAYILCRRLTTSTDLTACMSLTVWRSALRFIGASSRRMVSSSFNSWSGLLFHFHRPHPLHSRTDPSNRENCSRTRLP